MRETDLLTYWTHGIIPPTEQPHGMNLYRLLQSRAFLAPYTWVGGTVRFPRQRLAIRDAHSNDTPPHGWLVLDITSDSEGVAARRVMTAIRDRTIPQTERTAHRPSHERITTALDIAMPGAWVHEPVGLIPRLTPQHAHPTARLVVEVDFSRQPKQIRLGHKGFSPDERRLRAQRAGWHYIAIPLLGSTTDTNRWIHAIQQMAHQRTGSMSP